MRKIDSILPLVICLMLLFVYIPTFVSSDHVVQYPDPTGWDVAWQPYSVDLYHGHDQLADDFYANQTGFITCIHFWVSSYDDLLSKEDIMNYMNDTGMGIMDAPGGNTLWTLGDHTTNVAGPFYGDEGWMIPGNGYEEHNHQQYWRVDIENISGQFYQMNGTIYWLVITANPDNAITIGWKTSQNHDGAPAEWGTWFYDSHHGLGNWVWNDLYDPINASQIDFAFCINDDPINISNIKMTNPQYPDSNGWDVYFGVNNGLADDWLCNSSGNVTGVHLWVSSEGDSANLSNLQYEFDPFNVGLSIYSNNATYPSHPGDVLWYVDPMGGITFDLNITGPFYGDEGWYDPYTGYYMEHDHLQFWRVDMTNITHPFYQVNGTIYWLNIAVPADYTIGWKTSRNHFMDNAVNSSLYSWYPLADPTNMSQMDLAFVITGEAPISPPPQYGDNTTFANIKMTNPQYPDPFGWDIAWGAGMGYTTTFLADDWVCNQSGNITGIHFWISSYNDSLTQQDIQNLFVYGSFDVAVFHNDPNPPGNYSQPIYESPWLPALGYECTVNVAGPYSGDEGWFTVDGGDYQQHNHAQFWRIDITDFTGQYSGLFHQELGNTYWLAIISRISLGGTHTLGWKTSADHFMDNAVWSNEFLYSDWQPIVDPINMTQIDLAFVITGEAPLPSNSPPNQPTNEYPLNNSLYVKVETYMNVTVSDPDGNSMTVVFKWDNGTTIATLTGIANNSVASIHIPDYQLIAHDTTYQWYVVVSDGIANTTSPIWNFHTSKAWDLNEDATVNYLDVSALVSHYGDAVSPPGSLPWDINNDGNTNYLDVSNLVSHYGESY